MFTKFIGGARNCDEYDTGALHTREHKSQNASAIVKRISRRVAKMTKQKEKTINLKLFSI